MSSPRDRAWAHHWAEKALICWVEGSAGGYVGPKVGNSSSDGFDESPEMMLSRKLAAAVETVVATRGMTPHSREMLRAYVASRQGKDFLRRYVWKDFEGRPQRATVLMILQASEIMRCLVKHIIANPSVTKVKMLEDEVA